MTRVWDLADLADTLRAADVGEETLYLASEVARWSPGLPESERRPWQLLVIASLENQQRGSTRLPIGDVPLGALLASLGVPAADCATTVALAARLETTLALQHLLGRAGDYKPFIVEGRYLYHQRELVVERRLAEGLGRRMSRPLQAPGGSIAAPDLERALIAAEAGGRPLSVEQRSALRAALLQPVTVIAGGPGTGKTSIIVALLRALTALGVTPEDIAVAAPTGKAANRIAESLDAEKLSGHAPAPQTVHRLLGYRAGGAGEFRHHQNHRLPQKVVIIDEGSMIDLVLMDHLVRAVSDDARLVLLGDANQLPSLEAGAVFRDLGSGAITLTQSYRMNPAMPEGRAILQAAEAVLGGNPDAIPLSVRARSADLVFNGVELLEIPPSRSRSALNAFLDRWYADRVAALPEHDRLIGRSYALIEGQPAAADRADLEALFRHNQGQRLLCVTRGTMRPTGAEAVNAGLHRRSQANHGATLTEIAPGEPVIMLRNDYDRGLFNGDQGLCLRLVLEPGGGTASARPAAVFPRRDGWIAFPLESLRDDLGLAHALTVHRAQGSEFDDVALILPEDELPLLSRELLYTAITRARRSVTIVGSRQILESGIGRRIERFCGLADRLAASAG